MYDEETQEAIADAPRGVLEKLELGYNLREEAKCQEEQADATKKSADIILEEVFDALGTDKIKHKTHGILSRITDRERAYYDAKKITEYLIGHGVSKTVTKNALEAGKKVSKSSYIEYKRPRKKKGDK